MHTSRLDACDARARCAIYTRKSFQPPIAQDMTSLESQRAICSSYIASQQHKGWVELEKRYEDCGVSGGSLDRPALRELLVDVENGLVEIVVVYKLDRVSRTLLDFVRLMDFFERYGVIFVAITQNFDTSDSMGRLIRNVLLTFAQFEREIASDRMRDKRMVMKRSGMWVGGDAPLGYDLRRRKLVPNPVEALAVRRAFETYVSEKRISAVHRKLTECGFRRKVRRTARGRMTGGGPIALSSLHHILRNPVYIGRVTHKGETYPGIHQPIIDERLWAAAQQVLKERAQFKPRRPDHLLTGVLFDAYGRRLYARDYWRGGKFEVARFYESPTKVGGLGQRIKRTRVRALQLESIVIESLKTLLVDQSQIRPLLMQANVFGSTLEALSEFAPAAAIRLGKLTTSQLSGALKALISRVEVAEDCVRIVVRNLAVAKFIGWDGVGCFKLSDLEWARATRQHVIGVPVALMARRRVEWLPIDAPGQVSSPDPDLVKMIRQARRAQEALYQDSGKPLAKIAQLFGKRIGAYSHFVRLNYLAPDIVSAIFRGTQPPTLTRRKLLQCELPMDWALQRRLLGFPSRQAVDVLPRSSQSV